jgi:hypothetical protein
VGDAGEAGWVGGSGGGQVLELTLGPVLWGGLFDQPGLSTQAATRGEREGRAGRLDLRFR